jgi:hypothetical protein
LPQGLPKKIEFQLLLADLALELRDPLLCRLKLVRWLRSKGADAGVLRPRASSQVKPGNAKLPVAILPSVKKRPADPQFLRQRPDFLTAQYAFDDGKLRLRAERPRLLWHQSSSENCHLFIVSHFWGALHFPVRKCDNAKKLEHIQFPWKLNVL